MKKNCFAAVLLFIVACSTRVFAADPLLVIDQHRASVVQGIVSQWASELPKLPPERRMSSEQLANALLGLRADRLLTASLAGSFSAIEALIDDSRSEQASALQATRTEMKSVGDTKADLTYTPVTPCRLVETRPGTFAAVYQGGGAFAPNEIRNYAAVGGNSVCLSQLPAGLNPAALQLQVFGIPINSASSGDIEILPQGSTFGSTATVVYLGAELLASASTTAGVNLANNQIGVQVRGPGANVAIDVVGYFKAPGIHTKNLTLASPGFTSLVSFAVPAKEAAGGYINYTIYADDGGSQIATERGIIQFLATSNTITCMVQTDDKLHIGTVNSGCTPGFFSPGSQPGVSVFDNVSFFTPAPIVNHRVYFEVHNISPTAMRLEP